MREIKFRALYDHMGGGWKYGMLIYEGEVPRIQEKGTMLFSTCLKGTEGQYTGLKDKNGKEIYEEDVVEAWVAGTIYERPHMELLSIVFKQGTFCAENERRSIPLSKLCKPSPLNKYYECFLKGNIHQNPELLNTSPSAKTEGDAAGE